MLAPAAVSGVIARTYDFCVELGKPWLPGVVEEEHSVDHFVVKLSIFEEEEEEEEDAVYFQITRLTSRCS